MAKDVQVGLQRVDARAERRRADSLHKVRVDEVALLGDELDARQKVRQRDHRRAVGVRIRPRAERRQARTASSLQV
eukprot:3153326-Prymnesium_polylepis.1